MHEIDALRLATENSILYHDEAKRLQWEAAAMAVFEASDEPHDTKVAAIREALARLGADGEGWNVRH